MSKENRFVIQVDPLEIENQIKNLKEKMNNGTKIC